MPTTSNALEVNNLNKIYPGGVQALHDVSFHVERGDFMALLGANGAGKTTTLGIVSSIVNKSSGRVSIYGHDLDRERNQAKVHLGVVPQEFNCGVFETVGNIVAQQAGYYGIPARQARQRARYYLEKLDLWDKRDEQSIHLSGGMKRRLMIARALVHEPDMLILDEPTAGVDIEIRRSMWDFLTELNRAGRTIILTTHYLEEAEQLCRNVTIIDQGRIRSSGSKRALLDMIERDIYVCELSANLEQAPQIEGLDCSLRLDGALELQVVKGQSINQVLSLLSAAGVEIKGIRPKHNRLEELFINLTHHD